MFFIKPREWLKEKLLDNNVRIVDCTYSLNDASYGKRTYCEKHIPGAVHFDLAEDLSDEVQKHGGRHPLPEIQKFKRKLEIAGINDKTTIVAYDAGEGCFASRFWWLLKYMGHPEVYVLDGGMKGWEDAGFPVTDIEPEYDPVQFTVRLNESMIADVSDVRSAIKNQNTVIIDSRARERYLGQVEPLDAKPGHIPGAVNCEWTDGLKAGIWKDREEQMNRFSNLNPGDEIIVYCGSGVTATPNVIALTEAGFDKVKLYAGSYSDWISYPENIVEKGEI
ncbi:rhodanese domain-containing protein [Bacillus freudenreichii]|nr:rhodanese domain-containing protein [Bacillus freudenreichii]